MAICKTDGCDRVTKRNGLCNRCSQRDWRARNPKRSLELQRGWRRRNLEQASVRDHYGNIFIKRHPAYVGLPYYDGWNPKKGGSFAAGAHWIIKNLGIKPVDGKSNLHIVDRRFGFVPGNLQWVAVGRHQQEEMVNRLLLEVQNLKAENRFLRLTLGSV